MTTEEKVARRKLSLLELASDLNNVSKACQVMGYSRQQFYEIRRNYQTFGAEGLLERTPGGGAARQCEPSTIPFPSLSRNSAKVSLGFHGASVGGLVNWTPFWVISW